MRKCWCAACGKSFSGSVTCCRSRSPCPPAKSKSAAAVEFDAGIFFARECRDVTNQIRRRWKVYPQCTRGLDGAGGVGGGGLEPVRGLFQQFRFECRPIRPRRRLNGSLDQEPTARASLRCAGEFAALDEQVELFIADET